MLRAICDESYAGHIDKMSLYVVAGFVAKPANWETFETRWTKSMRDFDIEEIGCHASQCEYGSGAYRAMTQKKRHDIQESLIGAIVASKLSPAVSVVDVEAYKPYADQFRQFLGRDQRKYLEPHILAADQCVFQMCRMTDESEPITFVFDRNNEFGGRVAAWHQLARKRPDHKYHRRLGPLVHSDRKRELGLQAADMLAYAAFRNANGRRSWQWNLLKSGLNVYQEITGQRFWKDLSELMTETTKPSSPHGLTE